MAKTKPEKKETGTTLPAATTTLKSMIVVTKKEETAKLVEKWDETVTRINEGITKLNAISVITNHAQAKILDSAISDAKKLVNEIIKTGEELRKPYNQAAKLSKEFFDEAVLPIQKALEPATKALTAFIQEEKEKEQKRLRELQEEENRINLEIANEKKLLSDWVVTVSGKINNAYTKAEMIEIFNTHVAKFTTDPFVHCKTLAAQTYASIKELGAKRMEGIKTGLYSKAEPPVEQPEDNKIQEQIAEAPVVTTPVVHTAKPVVKFSTKTRNILKWSVPDPALVTHQFKSVDPQKVEAFKSEHSEMIKAELENSKEYSIGGIKFFYEEQTYSAG